jgi:hypothetical protein
VPAHRADAGRPYRREANHREAVIIADCQFPIVKLAFGNRQLAMLRSPDLPATPRVAVYLQA